MMRELTLDLPAVRLRALAWDPPADGHGRLAVLLHGFPDSAHTWRFLGPELAADGWRVIAPFTRGYAPSDAPADGSCHIAALADDAAEICARHGNGGDAVLVGHDWGAITANALAAHPDNPYTRVASLAVPPLAALSGTAMLRLLPAQVRNSWYIAFNQVPRLPERSLDRMIAKLWADWSPGYAAEEDVAWAQAALASPAHRRAALGYYRNMVRPFPRVPARYRAWAGAEMEMPRAPLLYLHGERDGCLDARVADIAARALPPSCQCAIVPDSGHFLHLEQPRAVNALVRTFLNTVE